MPDSTHSSGGISLESLRARLRGYRVEREIGHGAMGIVFEALQLGLGRRVAVKVLPPNLALRERTVRRFLREAEAMGKLAHPGIVDVFEVGSLEDLHFFSMKFVEGPPLDRVLRAGPLAIDDVLQIGIEVAGSLAHAHARGVLHRDVKPANLLRDGERVVLTDFGLARPIDSADGGSMTESGDLVGTPLYMAPEQISGDAERVDGRADLWGLGVTLYELLTGRTPFLGPNAQGILHAILQRDPQLVRRLRDDVPRDLEAVILKCLEKDSGRRYSTAAALREDLQAVRDGRAVAASRPRFFDPGLRWTRRHPAEATVLGVVLGVALLLAFYLRATSRRLETATQGQKQAEVAKQEAVDQQEDYLRQKRETWARYEISEVKNQAARADTPEERVEAEQRLLGFIEQIPVQELPDIAAEAIEMLSGWLHQRGVGDSEALKYVAETASGNDPKLQLFLRAAALSGQGRGFEALLAHRERALLDSRDPAPALDTARLMHRRALASREQLREEECIASLARALGLLGLSLELCVSSGDRELLLRIVTERARCLADLHDPQAALADLELVLARDPTHFEAFSLKLACERSLGVGAVLSASVLPAPAADAGAPLDERPALSIDRLLPGREEITEDLQSAGRNLQSIYRGLHRLLETAAQDEEPAAAEPDPPEGGPPQDSPRGP